MTTQRRDAMAAQFRALFDAVPAIWARAPGRVDLMGSHTDYNLGHVMTMTLDRDTWIAARARDDRRVRVHSANLNSGTEFALDAIARDGIARDDVHPWTNYVRGTLKAVQEAGFVLTGFDALVHSTVPIGGGLSSSAAIEMATAVALQQLGGFRIDPVHMALLGQQAENQFVGVNCGILDQYSSALGHEGCALLLDCRDLTSQPVPIHADLQVVICDTKAERNLAGTEYAERRAQCEDGVRLLRRRLPAIAALRDVTLAQFAAHERELPEVVARRCRFIIEENARVLALAEALPAGDRAALGALFAASYAGARDLYEIGAPAMGHMMAAMTTAPGVVAARQAGAGFGGCMVALVERGAADAFAAHVAQRYATASGIQPSVFATAASAGAGPLDLTHP